MDQPRRFRNDVFVSASTLDAQPLVDGGIGWAPQLVQMLETMLMQRLGRKTRVWYDRRLSGDAPAAEEHAQALADSAVMVALVSPAYLASGWCRRELELFARQAPPVDGGRLSRIFPVLLQPVERSQMPAQLVDVLGYPAHRPDSDRPWLASAPLDDAGKRHLMQMVAQLAAQIGQLLKQLETQPVDAGAALPAFTAAALTPADAAPNKPPSATPPATAPTATRKRIFISYRREDSEHAVGRLADDLRQRFSADNQVFLDHASIVPGSDFADSLQQALAECAAVLVVIGPGWLGATDKRQRRRLDLDDDWVRNEVAACLRDAAVRVFPILVGGAEMPLAEELPTPLQTLARRQAQPLTARHWHPDVAALVRLLQQVPGLRT